jgi:hypothetical protein
LSENWVELRIYLKERKEEKPMKVFLSCTVVLIVILTGISAQAQGTLVVYDKFESKYLDPDLWFGFGSVTTGGFVLEAGRQIKTEPTSGSKALYMSYRGYAGTGSDSGVVRLLNRLTFIDGGNINTIQAKVLVKKVEAVGCAANSDNTEVQARLGGFFFSTSDTPTPGDATNDVFASIALRRSSASTSKPDVLELIGSAFHCSNASCTTGEDVGTEKDLGTVLLGQRVKLQITWDQANHQFLFQKGKSSPVSLPYNPFTFPDTSAPGAENGGLKRLDVFEFVANCTSQPRPVGHMEVYFDDVSVNAVP